MRTTLDLPDDLLQQVKIRAVKENRRLKDVIADLLLSGLREPGPPAANSWESLFGIAAGDEGLRDALKAIDGEIAKARAADVEWQKHDVV